MIWVLVREDEARSTDVGREQKWGRQKEEAGCLMLFDPRIGCACVARRPNRSIAASILFWRGLARSIWDDELIWPRVRV